MRQYDVGSMLAKKPAVVRLIDDWSKRKFEVNGVYAPALELGGALNFGVGGALGLASLLRRQKQ